MDISNDKPLQSKVIDLCHDHPLAGHYGFRKTLELVLRKYWWKGMSKDIKEYTTSCDTCQRNKSSNQSPMGKLMPLPTPDRNWQHITMDFIVKLPRSGSFDSILVVVDRRSKSVVFIPTTESITADETAKLVFKYVICKHGVPASILSDRGPQFRSRFWKALFNMLGTGVALSSAYHPETDGQSERVNQELEAYLRCFTSYNQDDWAELLPQAEFAHNNSYHSSIGMSPFFATTGQDAEIGRLNTKDTPPSNVPEANRLKERFTTIQNHLQSHLEKAKERYKVHADASRRQEVELRVGEEVMISTKNVRTERPTKKLDYKWIGPYHVKRKINQVTYEIELPSAIRIHPVFHISLLKKYIRPKDPSKQLPKAPPIKVNPEEEWVIKDILDVRRRGRGFEYYIDWEGFGPESRTWEPRWHLNDDVMLREWHARNPEKIGPFAIVAEIMGGDNVTGVTGVLSHDNITDRCPVGVRQVGLDDVSLRVGCQT
ncbi:hypothetical protein SeLEV6574_g08557 [Synchytrium endobioticum]|uniref:Integrase catalytic domain-containing protein n=1 Tax=Synchytrium endobioticum TaxID=286115 RepID=A0A507BZI0_9FUNG|nr:hypothetical protein SeLEV6574_g08557 [Synchytrium endobioticum]